MSRPTKARLGQLICLALLLLFPALAADAQDLKFEPWQAIEEPTDVFIDFKAEEIVMCTDSPKKPMSCDMTDAFGSNPCSEFAALCRWVCRPWGSSSTSFYNIVTGEIVAAECWCFEN